MWLLYFVVLFLSVFLFIKRNSKQKNAGKPQVPGLSKTSDKLGNLEDIAKAGSMVKFLKDLHARFGPIASYWHKDVYTVSLGDIKYLKVTEKMFDRHRALFEFAEPLISNKSLQFLNGQFGRSRHKLLSEPFGYSGCCQVFEMMKNIVREFTSQWRVGDKINLHDSMMRLAINIMLKTNFGYYFDNSENSERLLTQYFKVINDLDDVLNGLWAFGCDDEREEVFQKNLLEFKAEMRTIVQEHKRRKHAGDYYKAPFLDISLDNFDDEDEIVHQAITFMTGGFHTTGTYMTWFFYNLGLFPDIQAKVVEEVVDKFGSEGLESVDDMKRLDYTRKGMDETLRHAKIGLFTERQAETDMEVEGFHIPQGSQILNALCLTLDDKNSFKNPGNFDPDNIQPARKTGLAFSPFGFGVRKCPGYKFAEVEMALVATEILARFNIEIAEEDRNVQHVYGFITKPDREISVQLGKI